MHIAIISLLVLVTVVEQGASITVEDCPPGLTRDSYLRVYQDWCFQFEYERRKDYDDAHKYCQSNGGTLALVKTEDIQKYLAGEVHNDVFVGDEDGNALWIGLNDKVKEGVFMWEDGTTVTYSNWGVGQGPHHVFDNSQDCVTLSVDGHWLDEHCETGFWGSIFGEPGRPYICQYKATVTPTEGPTEAITEPVPTTQAPVESSAA